VEVCEGCGAIVQEEIHRRETWSTLKAQNDQRRKSILEKAEQDNQRKEIARNIADLSEPERHSFAIFSLSRIGIPAVEPLIETMRDDPDPDARYGAARTLGVIGDKKAIPHLTAALSDSDPAVRYCAIESLDAMNAVGEDVENLITDKFKWVRERARKALDSQTS
jgi:HEAT repeat protein